MIKIDKRIRLISLSRNFGHQYSVQAGIDHCSGNSAIIIDADLQDPPEIAKNFIALWEQGYDVVYGKRIERASESIFKKIKTSSNSALITLTHDPKIDEPALKHALKKKFFYIGALGSKKTHKKRCERLREQGFNEEEINSIHGPIGIKLGGKSAPEIALSIVAQLVFVSNKYKTI